mgnify:CR=1 FL=1
MDNAVLADCFIVLPLENSLKVKQLKIQHAQKMVSKLDKHEWDENCSFCMANPWLHETKQVADYLPKLIDEEQQILFDIDDISETIIGIEKNMPKEKLELEETQEQGSKFKLAPLKKLSSYLQKHLKKYLISNTHIN